jgi:hypothetical protein
MSKKKTLIGNFFFFLFKKNKKKKKKRQQQERLASFCSLSLFLINVKLARKANQYMR